MFSNMSHYIYVKTYRLTLNKRISAQFLVISTVFRKVKKFSEISFSSFCSQLSLGTCEKCQKFLVLYEKLLSTFKSKNFGSVFGQLDCLPKSEKCLEIFFSSFCYYLLRGMCEKCQEFLVLYENLPSDFKSTNFGWFFLTLTVFQKVQKCLEISFYSFCYHLSRRTFEKFQKFLVSYENLPFSFK